MSASTTAELPSIENLTPEQKSQLLALLIKDELSRQPVPLPIFVRLNGEELGHFRPKFKPPENPTPYPFTDEEREELVRRLRNPGPTFTYREWLALEQSEADAKP